MSLRLKPSTDFNSHNIRTLNSQDEPIRLDPICDTDNGGMLYLTFCPGKKQSSIKYGGINWDRCLDTDLKRINHDYDIDHVICLLEDHEFDSLFINNYLEKVQSWNMSVTHYPIRDKDIPSCMERFHDEVKNIYSMLNEGKKVVVHCAGGVGRSGTIASAVLCYAGFSGIDAIKLVQQRRLNAIKRPCQQHFICKYRYYYC